MVPYTRSINSEHIADRLLTSTHLWPQTMKPLAPRLLTSAINGRVEFEKGTSVYVDLR